MCPERHLGRQCSCCRFYRVHGTPVNRKLVCERNSGKTQLLAPRTPRLRVWRWLTVFRVKLCDCLRHTRYKSLTTPTTFFCSLDLSPSTAGSFHSDNRWCFFLLESRNKKKLSISPLRQSFGWLGINTNTLNSQLCPRDTIRHAQTHSLTRECFFMACVFIG